MDEHGARRPPRRSGIGNGANVSRWGRYTAPAAVGIVNSIMAAAPK
jgi:hypothetical protein